MWAIVPHEVLVTPLLISPEAIGDLLIAGGREVQIPVADCHHSLRCLQTHVLVGGVPHLRRPTRRGHWHGEHHPCGLLCSNDLAGCPGSRPGGDSIVHDHDGTTGALEGLPSMTESVGIALHLGACLPLHLGELAGRETGEANRDVVDEARPCLTDGSQGQLGLTGKAELAYHDDVQWRVECDRHLVGHWYTATGKTADDQVLRSKVLDRSSQTSSGVDAVGEPHIVLQVVGRLGLEPRTEGL